MGIHQTPVIFIVKSYLQKTMKKPLVVDWNYVGLFDTVYSHGCVKQTKKKKTRENDAIENWCVKTNSEKKTFTIVNGK